MVSLGWEKKEITALSLVAAKFSLSLVGWEEMDSHGFFPNNIHTDMELVYNPTPYTT
jgi:hypothetical protein